jgi:hypothetical protein
MIDWNDIEKACMSLDMDCVPQNAREWDTFIRQYENCVEYYEGRGHDFTFEGMTENERQELVDKHMYLGRGFKKSVFECLYDLSEEEREIFEGVEWNAVNSVQRVWCARRIYLNSMGLEKLPYCPEYVMGDFNCNNNRLTSLKGAPEYVSGEFNCSINNLESLDSAPEYVGGDFWCNRNNLTSLKGSPKYVGQDFGCINNRLTSLEGGPELVRGHLYCEIPGFPRKIPGTDLSEYVGLKESVVMNFKEFARKAPDKN